MTGTGEVDKLWRDFHINLKSAREKEVCSCVFCLSGSIMLIVLIQSIYG
jgi:hypothetical protein